MKQLKALIIMFCGVVYAGTPPINLFDPYDILMLPIHWPDSRFQFVVGYEGSFKANAYQDDFDETGAAPFCKKRHNILQLWQDKQDAIAAFKGFLPESKLGQFAQQLNINDDNGGYGHYIPCGDLQVHANAMFTAAYHFTNNASLYAFLPYFDVALKNVRWRECPDIPFYENFIAGNLIQKIEELACINLGSWHRKGVGDFTLLGTWFKDYIQSRLLLRNVRVGLRGGLLFPTGKPQDEDRLFAFPFGYDSGFGILFAGHLELWIGNYCTLGIDTQFLNLFGNTRARRIKINEAQTDLLLLAKIPTFLSPGFIQHYTLYLEASRFLGGLSARIAYQYTKQNESKIYLCSNLYSPRIANSAESLQDWTNHSVVFQLLYDGYHGQENARIKPYGSLFAKWGFNGRRAVLCDTVGFQIGFSY